MSVLQERDANHPPPREATAGQVAFVTNEREISKIATTLGIPKATAPPPIPRAPQQELFDEIPQDEFI